MSQFLTSNVLFILALIAINKVILMLDAIGDSVMKLMLHVLPQLNASLDMMLDKRHAQCPTDRDLPLVQAVVLLTSP